MADYSFIANAHPTFIEDMYNKYSQDPTSVEEGWRTFFRGFEYHNYSSNGNGASNGATATAPIAGLKNELNVLSIIKAYRNRGHLRSTTNPIRDRKNRRPNLDLADFNLTDADMNTVFQAGEEMGLKNAIDHACIPFETEHRSYS